MANEIKTLRLGDMVFNRQGVFVRRLIHAIVSLALRLFFRRLETVNASAVPYNGPLLFVANHQNGLIDPALVFVALPRRISFLAKSTLFKIPGIAYILKVAEALPVYRRIDSVDVSKNQMTFQASHDLLQKGGAIALFPEGISHNSPMLLPMKTGAARIALGAISGYHEESGIDLKIVPVGLYYTSKTRFRSEALMHFGEPFRVKPVALEDDGDLPREKVKGLTRTIENALRQVTVNAESQAEIETANEAANLFLSVSETFDWEETLTARSEFIREYLLDSDTDNGEEMGVTEITNRISAYKQKLRRIGLEPENLSLSSQPFWYVFQRFVLRGWLLILFSPLALVGAALHFPAYQIIKFLGSRYKKHGVDDIVSSVKIISGIILMPLTWLIVAAVVYFLWNIRFAVLSVPISFLSGYVAMRTFEELYDMRGWFKATWLFFRNRNLFLELLLERRALHRELKKTRD